MRVSNGINFLIIDVERLLRFKTLKKEYTYFILSYLKLLLITYSSINRIFLEINSTLIYILLQNLNKIKV